MGKDQKEVKAEISGRTWKVAYFQVINIIRRMGIYLYYMILNGIVQESGY